MRRTNANVGVARAQAAEIERGVTLAHRVQGTDAVKEAGRLAYHLPFADNTRYLRSSPNILPNFLHEGWDKLIHVENAPDWWKPYTVEEIDRITKATLAKTHGVDAWAELLPGQKVAYTMHHLGIPWTEIGRASCRERV